MTAGALMPIVHNNFASHCRSFTIGCNMSSFWATTFVIRLLITSWVAQERFSRLKLIPSHLLHLVSERKQASTLGRVSLFVVKSQTISLDAT